MLMGRHALVKIKNINFDRIYFLFCRTADPCSLTLAAPQDGTISCTGVATDENCTFTCDPGFSLFGEFVSTCQPNHLWSSPTPRCTRLRCDGPPVSPSNGHVVQPCSYAFGQTCHIACSKGYSLERGATNRSCIATPENPENPFWTTDITTFCGGILSWLQNVLMLFIQMLMNARIVLVDVPVSPIFLQTLDVSHSAATQWALITAYVLKDMFSNLISLLVKVT